MTPTLAKVRNRVSNSFNKTHLLECPGRRISHKKGPAILYTNPGRLSIAIAVKFWRFVLK